MASSWVVGFWRLDRPRRTLYFKATLVSIGVADEAVPLRFAAGAAFGLLYEVANAFLIRVWSFPNDRFLIFRGPLPISLAAGLPWGILPVVATIAASRLRGG